MTASPAGQPQRLPPGWKWAKLGDVIGSIQPGFACGDRDPNGVVQVRMNNVTILGSFNWEEVIRVPSGHTEMAKYWLAPGDVLFNNTNSAELVGKSAMFAGFAEPAVYSNHFSRLRPDSTQLDADFPGKLADPQLAARIVCGHMQSLGRPSCGSQG